jgi:O-acetyl-ADP-ribose deacetylase (regulator of RNase III)
VTTPLPVLRLAVGDLLVERASAIVAACPFDEPFAAPEALYGFERMVYKSGGPEIFDELRAHGPLPAGAAVATGAGRLAARWVLHVAALGPGGKASPAALFGGLGVALRLAVMLGAGEVALPLVGAGAGGLGAERALGLIVSAWAASRRKPAETRVVVMTRALAARLGPAWGLDADGEGLRSRDGSGG